MRDPGTVHRTSSVRASAYAGTTASFWATCHRSTRQKNNCATSRSRGIRRRLRTLHPRLGPALLLDVVQLEAGDVETIALSGVVRKRAASPLIALRCTEQPGTKGVPRLGGRGQHELREDDGARGG